MKKNKNDGSKNNGNKSSVEEFGNDAAAYDADLAGAMSDDEGPMTEEQQKAIHEQFQSIYDKDPELRRALEKSDVASFSLVEKYQIIEAYLQGGAAGLQIELDDDDDELKQMQEMSEEELAMIE